MAARVSEGFDPDLAIFLTLDYYIIGSIPGSKAVPTRAEWNAMRQAAGKPTYLQ